MSLIHVPARTSTIDLPNYHNANSAGISATTVALVPYDNTPSPSPSSLEPTEDNTSSETALNPTADNTSIKDDLADLASWVEKISGQVTAYAEKARRCKRKFMEEEAQRAKQLYEHYAKQAYVHRSEYEDLYAQYHGREESVKKKTVIIDDGLGGYKGDGGRRPDRFWRRGSDYIPGKYAPKPAIVKLSESSSLSPAINLKVKPDHLDTSHCSLSWLEYWYVRRSIALQENDEAALRRDFSETMEEYVIIEDRTEEERPLSTANEEQDLYGDDEEDDE